MRTMMGHVRTIVIVAYAAVVFQVIESSQNPGLKARITAKGFNYAAQTAIDSLSMKIRRQKIPDQHGHEDDFKYSLTDIKITDFTKPHSNVVPQAGRGLTWQATGLGLSLHANFKYKYTGVIIPISDDGNIDVSISSTTFSLSVAMGTDSDGRPSITATSCDCNIGDFSIDFHGGTSWLYNILSGLLEGPLKRQVQDIVCTSAKSGVDGDAEKSLSELPVTVDIDHKFLLDYRLLSPPSFTSTYMDTFHKGEVFWSTQISEAPFSAPAIPTLNNSSKMMYLMTTDYMVNTLGYVAYVHNILKTNVTDKDLPPDQKSFLNTTCQGLVAICLGKLIPQTGVKYPNSVAELHMSASQAPKMTISPTAISLNFMGDILFYARVPNGSLYFMFSVNVRLNTTLIASVKDEMVYGEIDKMSIEVNLTKSEFGNLDATKLQTLLNAAIMLYVKPQLNKLGAKGFPLPVTGRVTFTNTELTLAKDALILGTDVKYSPKQLGQHEAKQSFQVIDEMNSNHHKHNKM